MFVSARPSFVAPLLIATLLATTTTARPAAPSAQLQHIANSPDAAHDTNTRRLLAQVNQERQAKVKQLLQRDQKIAAGTSDNDDSNNSPGTSHATRVDPRLAAELHPLDFDAASVKAGPDASLVENDRCKLAPKAWPECVDYNTTVAPLLVTGVGRSGTHHLAWQLDALGVNVCHETLCNDGAVGWPYAVVHSGHYVWEHQKRALGSTRFKQVFHLVRNPIDVVASLTTFSGKSWSFIATHTRSVPALNKMEPKIKRALVHWITWNRHIEQFADWRFQTETITPQEVCRRAGFADDLCSKQLEQPVSTAHREHRALTWKNLEDLSPELTEEARKMARRYGYTEEELHD